MKLKKYEGLSSYLIDEVGGVYTEAGVLLNWEIEKKFENRKMIINHFYKLKTDDLHGGFNIVRRFSLEDIVKMYNSPKAARVEATVITSIKCSDTVQAGSLAGECNPSIVNPVESIRIKKVKGKIDVQVVGIGKGIASDSFAKTIIGIEEGLAKLKPVKELKITSKIRTPKEQKKLLKKGRKKPVKSLHNKPFKPEGVIALVEESERVKAFLNSEIGTQAVQVAFEHGIQPPFFVISGVPFRSARSASKDCGISVNTVLKRCKLNQDGYFYIEK